MPDNVPITPGSGANIATDDIGGVQYQRVKIGVGADGSATDLAFGQGLAAASLPVVIASDQSAITVSGPATDAQLRATPLPVSGTVTANAGTGTMAVSAASLPLPAGAATEASLATVATNTGRLPTLVSGRVPVDGSAVTQPVSIAATVAVSGPVTDAQIRATPLPVSGTVTANAGTGTMAVSGPATDAQLRATPLPVSGTVTANAGTGTMAVSAAALPLPAGAATEASLATVATNTGRLPTLVSGRMPVDGSAVTQPVSIAATVAVSGPVTDAQIRATPLPVSGTVTANAGTGTMAVSGPLTDVEIRATPLPVSGTVTANAGTGTMAVSAAALPLPSGAATETTLSQIDTKIPALGQAVMASSQPVTIASNQSVLPVNLPAMVVSSYSQAGVISINTDLLIIDCNNVEAVSIQCTSMGTSGVVTPSWSNDNTTFVNASIMTQAGVAAATFNAAGLWTTPVLGRYLRLRLTVAASAGTTTLSVQRLSQAANIPLVSQPVAVAGTVPVSGTLTSAGTTTNTPVTPTTTLTNSAATNNAAFFKASAGTVWAVQAFNAGALPVYVKYYNRTTAPTVGTDVPVMVLAVPATSSAFFSSPTGFRFATGIAFAIVTGAADSDNTAVAVNQVKVATSWT